MVAATMTELWRLAKRNPHLMIRLLSLLATVLAVLVLVAMAIVTLA